MHGMCLLCSHLHVLWGWGARHWVGGSRQWVPACGYSEKHSCCCICGAFPTSHCCRGLYYCNAE